MTGLTLAKLRRMKCALEEPGLWPRGMIASRHRKPPRSWAPWFRHRRDGHTLWFDDLRTNFPRLHSMLEKRVPRYRAAWRWRRGWRTRVTGPFKRLLDTY